MLIRVLEIPASSGSFHFSGAEKQTFLEVDWLRDETGIMDTKEGRNQIADFIRKKSYFNSNKAYLVLHQNHTFTIGYSAP